MTVRIARTSTNVTGAIKNSTSLQQVNDCDLGYDDGWNKYCHMGLARHSNAAAVVQSPVQKQRHNHLNTSDRCAYGLGF
jgi:hypothetical protein